MATWCGRRTAILALLATGMGLPLWASEPACVGAGPAAVVTVDQVAQPWVVEERSLLAITPEMRRWLTRTVPPGSAPERLRSLLRALLADASEAGGAGLDEVPGPTVSPAGVWASRRANCVGFAFLVVALGRELGLPVSFALADGVDGYSIRSDLRVGNGHLAASFDPMAPGDGASERWTLDFGGLTKAGAGALRPVSDRTALAVFRANQGAERLLSGGTEVAVVAGEAAGYLERAVELDPQLEQAWVNLGVARARAGDATGARQAYCRALELAPESASARRNLALLLAAHGEGATSATGC